MAERKYTEARKSSNLKWDAANLDRMSLALPKGSRDTIKAHAAACGESVNAFIKRAVDCQMERDSGGIPSEIAQQAVGTTQGGRVVSLPSETLEAAQRAAEAAGEAVPDFIRRAVETQVRRDKSSLRMGLNPATGDKLEQSGGVSHE